MSIHPSLSLSRKAAPAPGGSGKLLSGERPFTWRQWMLLRLEGTSTNKGLFMTCSGFTESREQMLLNGGTGRPAKHPPAAREKLLANCRRLHRSINVVRSAQTQEWE